MSEQIRTSGISTLEALAKEISERYQKKTDMQQLISCIKMVLQSENRLIYRKII